MKCRKPVKGFGAQYKLEAIMKNLKLPETYSENKDELRLRRSEPTIFVRLYRRLFLKEIKMHVEFGQWDR